MIKREALRELDFFKVLELIEGYSNSEATKRLISHIYPSESIEKAKESLREFEEIKEYFERGGELPLSNFPDLEALLNKASKEGVIFDSTELRDFLKFLRVLDRVSLSVESLFNYKYLSLKIRQILGSHLSIGQPYLLERLENTVDEEGYILDTASSTLKFLRRQIRATEERIKEKLEEILNRKDIVPFLQDRFITKRNDRWVIPVRMDSKGQVRGKVHDISRSGETAFIEPDEIAGLSKRLEELRVEERLEEIRILKEISQDIHQISDTLAREFNLLCYLDKLCSIYNFSKRFKANAPDINLEDKIELIDAYHPLLLLTKDTVEPLNLFLRDKKVLVITGPNAGGKTVAIKTVGLLSSMALAGLPIPASPSSSIPFFSSLYVDLYHEGSISEQLSSFASHVVKLKEIIEEADRESLVILDEIGTNTDPEEGSALACAIIEELRNRGTWTFVTTHLSKVKLFAASSEGMEVAAMLFDEGTMTPLYRLSIGSLTTSYALEVAKKYGFSEKLIKRAYEIKGSEDLKIYQLMSEIQRVKEEYERKLKELREAEEKLKRDREKIEIELKEAEQRRRKALEEGKREAELLIAKLKRELNQLYEEAKRADKRKLKEISQRVSEISQSFEEEKSTPIYEVAVGEIVRVKNLNIVGKVIETSEDGKIKIQTEGAQIEVKATQVEPVKDNVKREQIKLTKPLREEKLAEEVHKLDIRGMRVDEAIPLIERFINELSLSTSSKGYIIHGIGKGILKEAVRDYLREHPAVANFRKGEAKEGGEAVTVVELK